MGRHVVDSGDEKTDKSSEKGTNNSGSDSDSDLDEEEFVVEKILDMRTTRKGKVQCKIFIVFLRAKINEKISVSCRLFEVERLSR